VVANWLIPTTDSFRIHRCVLSWSDPQIKQRSKAAKARTSPEQKCCEAEGDITTLCYRTLEHKEDAQQMNELPTGTVTFLFTDVEGSTKLWERYPEAMRATMARHDEVLREVMDSSSGYVFKTVGDAFCVAFSSAPTPWRRRLARNGRYSPRSERRPVPCGFGWRCTRDPPTRGKATTSARP